MSIASSQLVPNVGSEAGPTTQTDSRADRYKTQFVTYCEAIQLLRPYAVNKSDCRGAIYDTFDVDYWIAMRLFSGGRRALGVSVVHLHGTTPSDVTIIVDDPPAASSPAK